ncbi:MAG: choice-of-anchor J domain-containing protein [Crocinitomicaceae bacterium]|nr:choice-of-anchor J domain-containing protein [Crocinitomicaceae bacterium]
MQKNYMKPFAWKLFSLAFTMGAIFSSNAQSVGTQSFTATGNDDDPTTIVVTTSGGNLTINQGQPIQSITISDFYGVDTYGDDTYCGDYFGFTLNVDGSDVITEGCAIDMIGYDLTGASTITVTSVDMDFWSEEVQIGLELEVTYTTPTCLMPVNGIVDAVTSSSADVSWTAGDTETSWIVEWGEAGFTPGSGIGTQTVSSPSISIPGLDPNTDYDILVIADCGSGDESYHLTIPVLTACAAIPAIAFCESFETDSPNLACWSVIDENGDGAPSWYGYNEYMWTFLNNDAWGDNIARTGEYTAAIYTDYNSGANDDYLVTPPMTLTGNEVMNFYYRVYSSNEPNDFRVLLSTTGNSASDFTEEVMPLTIASNEEYQLASVDLSAYSGDVYIAFHVPAGGEDGWLLMIDDVCIDICTPNPGIDGDIDACRTDGTIDLGDVITSDYTNGEWKNDALQSLINGSMLNVAPLNGTYTFNYIVTTGCTSDTTIATINIFNPSSAGENGLITTCKNQQIDLFGALGGNIDAGGTWYAPDGSPMASSYFQTGTLQGQSIYKYIVDNGVCGPDTSQVLVNIQNCDYLGLEDVVLENMTLAPNPTNGEFQIAGLPANGYTYEVMDVNGRVIRQQETIKATTTTVDLTGVENGIYLIRISGNDTERIARIVKQ